MIVSKEVKTPFHFGNNCTCSDEVLAHENLGDYPVVEEKGRYPFWVPPFSHVQILIALE